MTDKILDKIKKLHLHAESAKAIGSEAEAQTFAEMVSKLLAAHKLEMTDIQFEEQRKNEPVATGYVRWAEHDIEMSRSKRIEWIETLAAVVARAHRCRTLVVLGSSTVVLVGTESNRQIAEYVLVTLVRTAQKIADDEYVRYFHRCRAEGDVTRARGFRAAFLTGFIHKISKRFDEVRQSTESGSTALVRFDKERADIQAWMDAHYGTAKKCSALSRNSSINSAGYRAGVNKADSMDLNGRAMNQGRDQKGLSS